MSDIVNPYIAGNPVTGPEMFFGREDIFQFIHQALIGQHRDNVIVLYGQRRTGKTSVLYQMRSHLDARYLCILMDMHGFALEGLGGFLWELANHILRVLRRDYQMQLPSPNRVEFLADPRSFFENELLTQVWSAIGDRHLLLMLDEVVYLQEQVRTGKLEHEIFEYMRHLMQHYERLNFVFALGSGLEELAGEYAFLFNVGLYKKISFLDRNAASDLMTQPVKDFYQIEPAALERMYHITSGHPYYTQLVCHCLFNRWWQQHMSSIGVRDVNEVVDEAVERGSAVLKHVWEESTPGEKAIMTGLAATMGQYNDPVDTNAINQAWASCDVFIPQGEMAKALRSLIARDVIAGQDKYAFTVDLQRLWMQKHRRLEWVKEEIADGVREWSSDFSTVKRPPPPPPRRISRGLVVLLVALVLMLIEGGVFLAYTGVILNQKHAPSYAQATSGNPSLNDPLSGQDDDKRDWNTANSSSQGGCNFNGNAYHIWAQRSYHVYACLANPFWYNFAYQVKMRILQGDYGGILFRLQGNNEYYYFKIFKNGAYNLSVAQDPTKPYSFTDDHVLKSDKAPSIIKTGLNQTNLVTVVAQESDLYLYVNRQFLGQVNDSTYKWGQIGVFAGRSDSSKSAEVVFTKAQVWGKPLSNGRNGGR